MKIKEVTEVLKSFGWQAYADSVGDKYAHFYLLDRKIQIIYGTRQVYEQQLEVMPSVSTDEFSTVSLIIQNIKAKKNHYAHIIRYKNGLDYIAPEILESHVISMSEEVITWAKEQDLVSALREYAVMKPEECLGNIPVKHLSSLVLLGDLPKLKLYQLHFEAGDRLGFVPYITKDYIDRAVELAEKQINNS